MNLSCLLRPSLGLMAMVAIACTPTSGTESGTESTGTTGEPTSTTGEPAAGCGVGEVAWSHTERGSNDLGARGLRVAVDKAGRIVVLAGETDAQGGEVPLVLVLDPSGEEVWRRTITGPDEPSNMFALAVDDAGQIFVGGQGYGDGGAIAGSIYALTADGEARWSFNAVGTVPEFGADIGGLALGHGELYSAGAEYDAIVVRRHDPATGEVAWSARYDEGIEIVYQPRLAVVGDGVVVAAQAVFGGGTGRPFVLRLDAGGAITSAVVEMDATGWWQTISAIGGEGELIVAGERYSDAGEGIAVRRAGPDGAEVWSAVFDVRPDREALWDAAVGPGQRIALVGSRDLDRQDETIPSVRCLAGDGAEVWEAPFAPSGVEWAYDEAYGVAFGPDSMVVVGGQLTTGTRETLWVRKYVFD